MAKIVIGIDPGGRTGLCAYSITDKVILDCHSVTNQLGLLQFLQELILQDVYGSNTIVVAIEDYLSAGTLSPDAKKALMYLGLVMGICQWTGVQCHVQSPQQRRPFLAMARESLREKYPQTPKPSPHMIDATAHALLYEYLHRGD